MQWFLQIVMNQHFLKNCLVLFCYSALQFRKQGIQKTKIILTIHQAFTYQYQQNLFPKKFFFKGNRNIWKHFLVKFTFQAQIQALSLLQTSNHTGIQVVTSDCAAWCWTQILFPEPWYCPVFCNNRTACLPPRGTWLSRSSLGPRWSTGTGQPLCYNWEVSGASCFTTLLFSMVRQGEQAWVWAPSAKNCIIAINSRLWTQENN